MSIAVWTSPNSADAHNVDSSWNAPSPTSFFFFHTSPDVGVFTYVGYNEFGGSTTFTRTQNVSSYTAYIRPQVKCWNGVDLGTYGWVSPNAYRNSGSCSSIGSTAGLGRVSINM